MLESIRPSASIALALLVLVHSITLTQSLCVESVVLGTRFPEEDTLPVILSIEPLPCVLKVLASENAETLTASLHKLSLVNISVCEEHAASALLDMADKIPLVNPLFCPKCAQAVV